MSLIGSDILYKLEELLEDSISPIKVAHFEVIDQHLNLKCNFSNIEQYEQGKTYNPYRIKPVLRVLLLKSKIIEEVSIGEIFLNDKKEICLVLDFNQKKSFFILSLEDITLLKDMQLMKVLERNIDTIKEVFSNE